MRIIAVDPDVIPLYSIVEIKAGETTFTAIALDTGSAIQGEIIDLLVSDKETAYKWGRRQVKVRIVEER